MRSVQSNGELVDAKRRCVGPRGRPRAPLQGDLKVSILTSNFSSAAAIPRLQRRRGPLTPKCARLLRDEYFAYAMP